MSRLCIAYRGLRPEPKPGNSLALSSRELANGFTNLTSLDATHASYGVAFASFTVLGLMLATGWRKRVQGSGLLLAVILTALWAALLAGASALAPGAAAVAVEVGKALAWIVFAGRQLTQKATLRARLMLYGGGALIAVLTFAAEFTRANFGHVPGLEPDALQHVVVLGMLLLSSIGLVTVEQAVRNTRAAQAWAVKFLWLATGSLFAYDLILYSAAFVTGQLPATLWMARGLTVALVAPLIAIGVTRVERFEPRLVMSQRLILLTTGATAAVVYLFLVALMAYFVRGLGRTWGEGLGVVVAFGGLLALIALFVSGSARARLRVLLAKHLTPYKYDYRQEWLDLTASLAHDTEGSLLAERIVGAFVRLTGAGKGGMWVRHDDVLIWSAGSWADLRAATEPCDSPFCRFVEAREWIVDLDRARARSRPDTHGPLSALLAENPDAWLAIPLVQESRLVALVVLCRPLVAEPLSWEDLDLMRTAARQAASYVALEQATEALSRERQFGAVHRFTAFLVHDLANVVAQQRLLVENAAKFKSNPEFVDDAISTIGDTVARMSQLLERLRSGVLSVAPERVLLADVCRRVVAQFDNRTPRTALEIADEDAAALVVADRLEHVIVHLVSNAVDATPMHGRVTVRVQADGDSVCVVVTDTGTGMDGTFLRKRLFRPFDTTKGTTGMGLGAFEAREFARAAGGDVEVTSAPGKGTAFLLRLPRLRPGVR